MLPLLILVTVARGFPDAAFFQRSTERSFVGHRAASRFRSNAPPPLFAAPPPESDPDGDGADSASAPPSPSPPSSSSSSSSSSYVEGLNFDGGREEDMASGGSDGVGGVVGGWDDRPNRSAGAPVPPPDRTDPRHTHVEGLNYDGDREAEVLAMGGDPFFLTYDDEDGGGGGGSGGTADPDGREGDLLEEDADSVPSLSFLGLAGTLDVVGPGADGSIVDRYATDGLGPTPRGDREQVEVTAEEWDGWAVEDAHFDFD